MHTTKADISASGLANSCQFNSSINEQAPEHSSNELLVTSVLTALGTVMGTAALIGIHHRYRKQRQPDAGLQDYVLGIRSRLLLLPALSKPRLTHFRHACQQATAAWQQACYTDSLTSAADFSVIHTTTLLARPVYWVSGVASMPKDISLLYENNENDFGVVGIDAHRDIVWQTTMPERVHDIVLQPVVSDKVNTVDNHLNHHQSRDIIVLGRRPSESFWVLDSATGQVKFALKAADNRHFYGHACYSLDGSKLYVTENETLSLVGKIGIYDVHSEYEKIAEFDSYGIGPHELIMHPDGETLVIANGGIKTEQASREELNLDTMRPSLVYLNRHDGSLLEQVFPEHNQMSVRHLAIHNDGTVLIGIQFQGERHINVPLVLTHKRGDTSFQPLSMPNDKWQRFHQYIASVAIDSERNLLCVTTPIGGCAAIFDLTTYQLIDAVSLLDCAGAAVCSSKIDNDINNHSESEKSGFIVSDGQGQLTRLCINHSKTVASNMAAKKYIVTKDSKRHTMSFDNHMQAL